MIQLSCPLKSAKQNASTELVTISSTQNLPCFREQDCTDFNEWKKISQKTPMSIDIKPVFSSSRLQILHTVNPCLNYLGQNREQTSESCSLTMSMTWDAYEENNSDSSVSVHRGCAVLNSYAVHKPKLNLWRTENFILYRGKNRIFPTEPTKAASRHHVSEAFTTAGGPA